MKRWTVVIDWIDGDVEDSDEIAVSAKTSADAVCKAVAEWTETLQPRWPSCSVQAVSVFAAKLIRGVA